MFIRHAAIAIALVLALPAAADDVPVTADTVVATVNGTEITLGHMIVLKQRLPAQYQQMQSDVLFEGILDQLVQQTLLGEAIPEVSKGARLSLENEERAMKASQAIRNLAKEVTTDDAVQAAYNAKYGGAEPETEYHAAHILVATEDEAKAIAEELKNGADFAQLARDKSTGPSGPNGGDLGWFSKGAMVQPFEEAVIKLKPGEVSGPVQTQFGWHVIELIDTRLKSAPKLEEVRAKLVDQIQRDAIQKRVADLTAAGSVTRVSPGDIDPTLIDNLSLVGD